MGWIKRNKFFVIGVILALGMLGAAGFYDYQSWNRNAAAFDKLNEIYGTLRNLTSPKISPGNDKVNNIEAAREQERQLRDWIGQTGKYFQPIDPVPAPDKGMITSEAFKNALDRTIHQLQSAASNANVTIPPQYGFSFEAQRSLVKFADGSLGGLAVQVGEVKTISELLFAARINSLDGIQRVRVSGDDTAGPQSDYIDGSSQTTDLAVFTPYLITFRAFSPEIAQVLSGFAAAPHAFIVKGINVQRAEGSAAASGTATANPVDSTPPPATPAPAPAPGRGGLQTVLQEQLLRVTLEVEIVKLSPRN